MKRFEEIDSWKQARILTKDIYSAFNSCKDYSFRDQIQRASISISANIAEGFERNTNKEFLHFLHISRGSVGEVRSFLYLALDLEYIDEKTFDTLYTRAENVSKLLY